MAYASSPQSVPTTSSLVTEEGASEDGRPFFDPRRWFSVGRKEAETVAYLDSLYERARTHRWRFERQWYVNLSYYFGRQWINWLGGNSPDIARLYEPQAPPWRVRLTVNRIKPAIRREMSKVMKEKPTAYVIPASTEDNDIAGAKAGEAIFEHIWRTIHMKDHLWIAQFWRCVCGTGFVKDWWDPHPNDDSTLGSVQVEIPTPFHMLFSNLDIDSLDRQEYVIHVAMKSPEAVKMMYGMDVKPDSYERGGGIIESQYLQALGLEPGKATQVCVKEIWIKPSVRYPAGAMFVWAGSTILYQGSDPMTGEPKWPLPKMEYPFTKFAGVPTGRFYGDSSIIDLLPLQKEYNRTRSQIIEAKNQMAKPQLMAPRGSIDATKITSEPGLVIFYQPGFTPPQQLKLEPLPNYVLQELDRSLVDIADISGQHEVSSGTVPTGVTAATALSFLQEQDDTMLAPIIQSMESGVERLGRHFLCHAHQYWDEPQTVKVLGSNNAWEAHKFAKTDLYGNTDLHVQAGSAMPRSLAARQAFIMELAKMGLIGPEETLRYLEMAETTRMYEESQVDRRQAERENMRMSDPSIILPQKFAAALQTLNSQFQDVPGQLAPDGSMPGSGIGDMGGPPPMHQMPDGSMMPGTMPEMSPSVGAPLDGAGFTAPGAAPLDGFAPIEPMPEPGMQNQLASPAQAGLPMPPPPPIISVNTWDNHETHIQVHNDYRKTQEFENLPPGLKEEFERHVALHRSALGLPPEINPQQMQQIIALQQATPQAPPLAIGPGGPLPGEPQQNGNTPEPTGTSPL